MWLSSLFGKRKSRSPHAGTRKRLARCRPCLELLESRLTPSVYMVMTTDDTADPIIAGAGTEADPYQAPSLRSAILAANANAGPDTIKFSIPADDPGHLYYPQTAGGPLTASPVRTWATDDTQIAGIDSAWPHSWWRIQPATPLPEITDVVDIEGFSQGDGTSLAAKPNCNGPGLGINAVLRIELDGVGVSPAFGLRFRFNGGGTVRGLVINQFLAGGIGGDSSLPVEIQGNFIGTDISGTLAKGNSSRGVRLASNSLIGTNGDGIGDEAERNLISGNAGSGVEVAGANNVIAGNFIGVDRTGLHKLGNVGAAIDVNGSFATPANGNRIGTDGDGRSDDLERNIISGTRPSAPGGTAAYGIIMRSNSHHNVVAGNYIGTNVTGTQGIGNGSNGVVLSNGAFNNRIGIDPSHDDDDPTNSGHPIYERERNVIASNQFAGVGIALGAHHNYVWGNYIGTQADGVSALGNVGFGVAMGLGSANNNQVGGAQDDSAADAARKGNVIAFNNGPGVFLPLQSKVGGGSYTTDVLSTGNAIRGNAIYANDGLGIDLGGKFDWNTFLIEEGGVTLNNTAGHVGPNNWQNFPVLTSASVSGGSTTVTGTFDSGTVNGLPFQSNATIVLDFYANASRGHAYTDPATGVTRYYGEGQTYLGQAQVVTDANGHCDFTVSLPVFVPAGQGYITATATGPDSADPPQYSTSEFSAALLNVWSISTEAGQPVTLTAPAGTALVDVAALPAPPAENAPPNADFPVGVFQFTVEGVSQGGTATVILYMPPGVEVNAYYKLNPATELWELFEGAAFEDRNGDGTSDIVLTLTDGGAGDADGEVNGSIVDPGLPAFVRPTLRVEIDIRPNTINLVNQGVIPVVLFGSAGFDVRQVNLSTVRFAGAAVFQWSYTDVNGDGWLDLVLKFRTQDTTLQTLYEDMLVADRLHASQQEVEVALTGKTLSEQLFKGSDDVTLFLSGKALRDLLTRNR